MPREPLAQALADAGGAEAPRDHHARLRRLVRDELRRGVAELARSRSGHDDPLVVPIAAGKTSTAPGAIAVAPVDAALRADPDAVSERGWLLVAALVGALVDAGAEAHRLRVGTWDGHLALHLPGPVDLELAVIAFDEVHVLGIDRLRAHALAFPSGVLDGIEDLRDPIGPTHPLRVAGQVAALGGRPADPASVAEHEDAVLARLEARSPDASRRAPRPHEDPDPARRVARRILQRLDGMGKWGGYHTEFSHLARGFAGNDRALAESVGEALLAVGLLKEKPSVGQRHVCLNPGRAADIRAAIDLGALPSELVLPSTG